MYKIGDMEISVTKNSYHKCNRCWKRSETVDKVPDYEDLCSVCAYDIDHYLVNNAEDFHKDNPEAAAWRQARVIELRIEYAKENK